MSKIDLRQCSRCGGVGEHGTLPGSAAPCPETPTTFRPGSAGGRSARYWRRAPQAVDATVSLTPLQQVVLGREAIRRGLLPEQLHQLIMRRVLEDGLVLAVLDE